MRLCLMAKTKRLFNAVDKFAKSMKTRLAEKAEFGYYGWNDTFLVSDLKLILELRSKTLDIEVAHRSAEKISKKDLIDISNFAMMLHRRF